MVTLATQDTTATNRAPFIQFARVQSDVLLCEAPVHFVSLITWSTHLFCPYGLSMQDRSYSLFRDASSSGGLSHSEEKAFSKLQFQLVRAVDHVLIVSTFVAELRSLAITTNLSDALCAECTCSTWVYSEVLVA